EVVYLAVTLVEAVVALGGNDLGSNLVVRLVGGDGIVNVLIKCVAAFGPDIDLRVGGRVLVQIAEEHGPFIDPLRLRQKLVDEGRAFVLIETRDELSYAIRGRNPAGEVERGAANELIIRGFVRGGDVVRLKILPDVFVDQVGRARGGGVERFHPLCLAFG